MTTHMPLAQVSPYPRPKVLKEPKTPEFLSDVPYNPEFSPKAFETAKNWLVDNQKKFIGNANFAWVFEDKEPVARFNQGCHASIGTEYGRNSALVATGIKDKYGVASRPFYHWLLHDSPFKDYILSDDDMLPYGLIVSTDMPAGLLQNIMILSRHGWEIVPEFHEAFRTAADKGLPQWLVYFTMFNSYSSWAGYFQSWDTAFNSVDSQHRISPCPSLSALRNFRDQRLNPEHVKDFPALSDPKLSYRHKPSIYGGYRMYKSQKDVKNFIQELLLDKEFREVLRSHRQEIKNVYVPNPFSAVGRAVPSDGISTKDVLDVALPFIRDKYL